MKTKIAATALLAAAAVSAPWNARADTQPPQVHIDVYHLSFDQNLSLKKLGLEFIDFKGATAKPANFRVDFTGTSGDGLVTLRQPQRVQGEFDAWATVGYDNTRYPAPSAQASAFYKADFGTTCSLSEQYFYYMRAQYGAGGTTVSAMGPSGSIGVSYKFDSVYAVCLGLRLQSGTFSMLAKDTPTGAEHVIFTEAMASNSKSCLSFGVTTKKGDHMFISDVIEVGNGVNGDAAPALGYTSAAMGQEGVAIGMAAINTQLAKGPVTAAISLLDEAINACDNYPPPVPGAINEAKKELKKAKGKDNQALTAIDDGKPAKRITTLLSQALTAKAAAIDLLKQVSPKVQDNY